MPMLRFAVSIICAKCCVCIFCNGSLTLNHILPIFKKYSVGYNKNVCKYVRNAREVASSTPGSHVTFVSNNTYENNAASLGECFERNAEGMLKNMAIHELALLASFYDVSIDNIDSVDVDKEFSSLQTLKGPRYVHLFVGLLCLYEPTKADNSFSNIYINKISSFTQSFSVARTLQTLTKPSSPSKPRMVNQYQSKPIVVVAIHPMQW